MVAIDLMNYQGPELQLKIFNVLLKKNLCVNKQQILIFEWTFFNGTSWVSVPPLKLCYQNLNNHCEERELKKFGGLFI